MSPIINAYICAHSDESAEDIATMFGQEVVLLTANKTRGADCESAILLAQRLETAAFDLHRNEDQRRLESPSVDTVKNILKDVSLSSPAISYYKEGSTNRSKQKKLDPSARAIPFEELDAAYGNLCFEDVSDVPSESNNTADTAEIERSFSNVSDVSVTKSEVLRQSEEFAAEIRAELDRVTASYSTVLLANTDLNNRVAELTAEKNSDQETYNKCVSELADLKTKFATICFAHEELTAKLRDTESELALLKSRNESVGDSSDVFSYSQDHVDQLMNEITQLKRRIVMLRLKDPTASEAIEVVYDKAVKYDPLKVRFDQLVDDYNALLEDKFKLQQKYLKLKHSDAMSSGSISYAESVAESE
ncbi:hypothetical protein CYMTET_26991 [Cymbomonas tetramitiformis]|uniref:Uncharacterized protein n=1 Tax=Cymbomonas tetramitiformis TaxID=36881 RepID=A0AAE0KXP5_9CHLO|nr:hypothetical protein CYMTET_26991 [Cymbomonas tetramitiformis]